MTIDAAAIRTAADRAAAAMVGLEQPLNAADAVLGDGDTGSMLARVVAAMAAADPAPARPGESEASAAFAALARAALAATGSSLGTLVATGLLAMAKATRGRDAVGLADLAGLLDAARDAMLARGGAALGDKTVLDGLDALAAALADVPTAEAAALRVDEAGAAVLATFRDRPCRIGRAKFFAERSIGRDDPGMLALVRLAAAIAAPAGGAPRPAAAT
jgi:dihydroxyacetone kinase